MIVTGYSKKNNFRHAIQEIQEAFMSIVPTLVIFFANSSHNPEHLAPAIQHAMESLNPQVTTVGCSAYSEFCDTHHIKGGIVAMAFTKDALEDFYVQSIPCCAEDDTFSQTITAIGEHFNAPVETLSPNHYLTMVIMDGLCGGESQVLNMLKMRTKIPIIGASSSDDQRFTSTWMYHNGQAEKGAMCVLCLKPKVDFHILCAHSLKPLPYTLTCTQVDATKRIVYEIDHEPAAITYAHKLGVPPNKLSDYFAIYPLGQIHGNTLNIISPRAVIALNAIHFYGDVKAGTTYHVLKSSDIVQQTKAVLKPLFNEFQQIYGLIQFNCILRTSQLIWSETMDAYTHLFDTIPHIGFSTYGELHEDYLNQTAVFLVFGSK